MKELPADYHPELVARDDENDFKGRRMALAFVGFLCFLVPHFIAYLVGACIVPLALFFPFHTRGAWLGLCPVCRRETVIGAHRTSVKCPDCNATVLRRGNTFQVSFH